MKKLIIGIVATILSIHLVAQSNAENPEKKWKFGFDLGLNYSAAIVNKPLPIYTSLSNNIGLRLGILAQYKLSKKLYLSPKTELSFNNARIEFEYNANPYRIMPVSIELMCPVLFRAEDIKYNPYFFAGPNLKIPVSKKSTDPFFYPSVIDLAIDFGVGCEERFSFFKFSPELRFSLGLFNVNRYPGINYLYNQSVSLVLKFIE